MGYWMGCVDLRGVGLELRDVLTAPTKHAATRMAKERGWPVADVVRAATRFNRFWMLGQWQDYGRTIRCAGQEAGTTVLLTLRPR
jgi:hypothetical protein